MMSPDQLIRLEIDDEFKSMVRPLQKEAYHSLEMSIRKDKKCEPIIIWNNLIIDGFDRYLICHQYCIPFSVTEEYLATREDAICWIAVKQLIREDISEENRKYLIGKLFEAKKYIYRRSLAISNVALDREESDNASESTIVLKYPRKSIRNPIAESIGCQYHISNSTVEKYGAYSRALDVLLQKDQSVTRGILSGLYKVAHSDVVSLSRMTNDELKKYSRKLRTQQKITNLIPRHSISTKESSTTKILQPEIKNMPAFDPDADVTGLSLTVPSWTSTLQRVFEGTDINIVSTKAISKLMNNLAELSDCVDDLYLRLSEVLEQ